MVRWLPLVNMAVVRGVVTALCVCRGGCRRASCYCRQLSGGTRTPDVLNMLSRLGHAEPDLAQPLQAQAAAAGQRLLAAGVPAAQAAAAAERGPAAGDQEADEPAMGISP